ncbi:hypothetical protein EYF80_066599 [Liparis tanakae]|uniref:Uncharacterized protein n=1 Tax=Liparis tanakae TaxID=230148 RepID=A0A4Z2E4L7_9TELE|nr:hypothetical protein EYF80_066599 [Liparis tanakae]
MSTECRACDSGDDAGSGLSRTSEVLLTLRPDLQDVLVWLGEHQHLMGPDHQTTRGWSRRSFMGPDHQTTRGWSRRSFMGPDHQSSESGPPQRASVGGR